MDTALKVIGGTALTAVIAALLVFIACVGGAAFGALGGWVVGWFFDDTLYAAQRAFHISPALAPWQLGAALGFVGGFFKTSVSSSRKSDD